MSLDTARLRDGVLRGLANARAVLVDLIREGGPEGPHLGELERLHTYIDAAQNIVFQLFREEEGLRG